jgi:hypothetical protein
VLRNLGSRALLIVLSLGVCGGRLHAHGQATPLAVQQELNCCLTMVRIAATRRSAPPPVRKRAIAEFVNWRVGELINSPIH